MPSVDFRIPRPDDNSDEGLLADVSEPLWSLWVGFADNENPEGVAGFSDSLTKDSGMS